MTVLYEIPIWTPYMFTKFISYAHINRKLAKFFMNNLRHFVFIEQYALLKLRIVYF